jgi:hypothetical protein
MASDSRDGSAGQVGVEPDVAVREVQWDLRYYDESIFVDFCSRCLGNAMTGRRVVRGSKVASGSRVKLGLAVVGLRNKVDSLYLESDYKGFMD